MAGKRDENEGTEDKSSSFMSRHFPDARPLQQNKRATQAVNKTLPGKKPVKSGEDIDVAPLHLPGYSDISADDVLSYQGNGVQNRVYRQLKQGKITPQCLLDLHGQSVEQAYHSTMQFIHQCAQEKVYCVQIIHGQGYRSAGGIPVLKQSVFHWLQQHPLVLAFHSAVPADGGKGALYALLLKVPGKTIK